MIVAFTGPEKPIAPARRTVVAAVNRELPPYDEYELELRTGAAHGIDSIAFFVGIGLFPRATQHVFVPQGLRYNQDLVGYAREQQCNITGVPGGYLKRDDALVEGADLLLAFPETMHEKLRSGTWATIRRAWKRDIEVRYFPLDGKPGPVVRCT